MMKSRQLSTPLLVLLALFVALTLGACETDQTEPGAEEETPPAGEEAPPVQQDTAQQGVGATDAQEIEGDPEEYMGQTVRLEGQVADVFGQNSFTLEGNWLGGNLLVVVPQGVETGGMTFTEGDQVQMTGDVREYVATDIETEYGVDLGADIQYEEQEPVVIAQDVTVSQQQQAE